MVNFIISIDKNKKIIDNCINICNKICLFLISVVVPPQRTASVAALPLSFEMGNIRAPNSGQPINQQNMPGYAYRLFSPTVPLNNAVNSPLSLQPSTSTFSNPVRLFQIETPIDFCFKLNTFLLNN